LDRGPHRSDRADQSRGDHAVADFRGAHLGASTDNGGGGLAGYTVIRDGTTTLANLGLVTSYTDSTVTAGSTHAYAVTSRDAAGNV